MKKPLLLCISIVPSLPFFFLLLLFLPACVFHSPFGGDFYYSRSLPPIRFDFLCFLKVEVGWLRGILYQMRHFERFFFFYSFLRMKLNGGCHVVFWVDFLVKRDILVIGLNLRLGLLKSFRPRYRSINESFWVYVSVERCYHFLYRIFYFLMTVYLI